MPEIVFNQQLWVTHSCGEQYLQRNSKNAKKDPKIACFWQLEKNPEKSKTSTQYLKSTTKHKFLTVFSILFSTKF